MKSHDNHEKLSRESVLMLIFKYKDILCVVTVIVKLWISCYENYGGKKHIIVRLYCIPAVEEVYGP